MKNFWILTWTHLKVKFSTILESVHFLEFTQDATRVLNFESWDCLLWNASSKSKSNSDSTWLTNLKIKLFYSISHSCRRIFLLNNYWKCFSDSENRKSFVFYRSTNFKEALEKSTLLFLFTFLSKVSLLSKTEINPPKYLKN